VIADNNAIIHRHSNNDRLINVQITDADGYKYECVSEYRQSTLNLQTCQELRKEAEENEKTKPRRSAVNGEPSKRREKRLDEARC